MFWECGEGEFGGGPKGQVDPENSRNAYKTRDVQQDRSWPQHVDWPQSPQKVTIKKEKKKTPKVGGSCRGATRSAQWVTSGP